MGRDAARAFSGFLFAETSRGPACCRAPVWTPARGRSCPGMCSANGNAGEAQGRPSRRAWAVGSQLRVPLSQPWDVVPKVGVPLCPQEADLWELRAPADAAASLRGPARGHGVGAGDGGAVPAPGAACECECLGRPSLARTRETVRPHGVTPELSLQQGWRHACTAPPLRSSLAGWRRLDSARLGAGGHCGPTQHGPAR